MNILDIIFLQARPSLLTSGAFPDDFTSCWGIDLRRAIMHDNELYPDPMKFDPERFLGKDPQTDPRKIAFGFGRRVCPGNPT